MISVASDTNFTTQRLRQLLDSTEVALRQSQDADDPFDSLCRGLNEVRARVPEQLWKNELVPLCRQHSVCALLHQDPYTSRAFNKPRGYAGDAVMLDFVYTRVAPGATTALGQRVFKATTGNSNAASVVDRRDHIATLIDDIACRKRFPRILSLACGHLREARVSRAMRDGTVGELFALDHDAEALRVVKEECADLAVTPVREKVRSVLNGSVKFQDLDLIYASGLYDYLSDAQARELTARLLMMLASEGTLLMSNFTPQSLGPGYMEAFMDWNLIYRDEEALRRCAAGVSPTQLGSCNAYRDARGNVAYVRLLV